MRLMPMEMLPQSGWAPLFPAMQSAGAPQMLSMGSRFLPAVANTDVMQASPPDNTAYGLSIGDKKEKKGQETGEGANHPAWDWTAVLEGHAESKTLPITNRETVNASSSWPSDDATTSLETSSDFEDRVDDLDFQLPAGARCADPLHEGEEMIATLLQSKTNPETDDVSFVVIPGLQHQDVNPPPADLCFAAGTSATAAQALLSVPRGRAQRGEESQDAPRFELESETPRRVAKKRKAMSADTPRPTDCPNSEKKGRVMAS